ncbi:hypothetical protein PIB30_015530 [Stylosanthes scabra]|uniref:Putative plant transposon protein domain-containing protein n=1 Tax=Stylosanthes scabra TaxID=79078 RepID=A0ABU6Z613_9FABA|nr:hypothetical protein [Stylosanthes scabra]
MGTPNVYDDEMKKIIYDWGRLIGPPGKYKRWSSGASTGPVGNGYYNRPDELILAYVFLVFLAYQMCRYLEFHRPDLSCVVEARGVTGKLGITLLRDLKVILQLPDVDVEGPSYEARKRSNDQRLGDVLRDICEDHAYWKLDIKRNPSQLRRHDLKPTVRRWLDFVRRSLMPTSNANEVTVDRAVIIHSIMEVLSIKAELLISHHISATAESKDPNKRLPFTGVIYRLLFANGFKKKVQGDKLIPIEKSITAESIMRNRFTEGQRQIPPQEHHQVQEEDEQEQQHQQEQHFQPPPQQFDFPQPPQQSFPQ